MNELYHDFIDDKANEIITGLGGTITPAPSNPELYRDFLERKFDDVINALPSAPSSEHHYSTTEQIIGTWIDGSTLYEKTVSATIINSDKQVIATIIGAKYKRIEGFYSTSSGVVPVPFNDGPTRYVPYTDGDDVLLAKSSASVGVGNTIVLILQYTKERN